MATTNIRLGSNTLNGVETIKLTDASDTTSKIDFTYGTKPSGSVSVKLGENTLTGVNEISVMGTDNVAKSFGYVPSEYSVNITLNETAINLRDYFRIYDGQNTSGTLLYEKTGTSGYVGTQTVTCKSGYLYFTAHSNSGGYAATFGGGFSNLVNVVAIGAYEAYAQAQILGNGSATLSLEYDG